MSYGLINKPDRSDAQDSEELFDFTQSSAESVEKADKEKPEFNAEAIKVVIKLIIERISKFTYYNITVIVQALARLNIRNEKIFTEVANRIVGDIEKQVEINIKPIEAVQIFSSFAKVGFFNIKLMRVLEDLFVMHIKSAAPQTIANMIL